MQFRKLAFAVRPTLFALLLLHVSVAQAQTTAPDDTRKYPNVEDGIELFKKGNIAGAFALFQQAKQNHPEISPPEVMLARLYYAGKKNAQGKNSLQSAVLKHPEDPEAWNVLGDLHLRSGNWAEAELLFQRGYQLAQKSEESSSPRMKNQIRQGLDGLIKTYETRKLWDKALVYLKQLKSLAPKNVSVMRRLAAAHLNLDQIQDARLSLSQIVEVDSQSLPPGITLANYYQRKGETAKAKSEIQATLQANPRSYAAQVAAARWAIAAGEWNMAEQMTATASRLDPDSTSTTLLKASIDLFKGKVQAAEAGFRKVNQQNPGNFEAVIGLAMSLLKQDDETKLQQALEHAQVLAKGNSDVRMIRGRQAYSILAWALFRNGQIAQAEKVIQGLAQTGELGPDAAYFAARIFAATEKKSLAKKLVAGALKSRNSFVFKRDASAFLKELERSN